MSSWRRRLFLAMALLAALVTSTTGMLWLELDRVTRTPFASSGTALLRIAPGTSLRQIARQVEADGWVPDYRLFLLRSRLDGVAERIQAGTYAIAAGDTLATLLERLVHGRTVTFTVTFVEGCRFTDMRRLLARQPYLTRTLSRLSDAEVMDALALEAPSLEGLFYPATYDYEDGARDLDILARAARRMNDVLHTAWQERAADLPYQEPYQALVMASIVEKETGLASERADVAGVFVRRLRIGMKLQTDPTVIYGLGEDFTGRLRRADLQRDHPHNTYVHAGLPPTPIAMPGRAAIEAALHPADGDALYFVARGDGGHQFSRSLDEHNAAVRRFQLRQ